MCDWIISSTGAALAACRHCKQHLRASQAHMGRAIFQYDLHVGFICSASPDERKPGRRRWKSLLACYQVKI